MNSPITRWCMRSVLEKHSVRRTSRLIRVRRLMCLLSIFHAPSDFVVGQEASDTESSLSRAHSPPWRIALSYAVCLPAPDALQSLPYQVWRTSCQGAANAALRDPEHHGPSGPGDLSMLRIRYRALDTTAAPSGPQYPGLGDHCRAPCAW